MRIKTSNDSIINVDSVKNRSQLKELSLDQIVVR